MRGALAAVAVASALVACAERPPASASAAQGGAGAGAVAVDRATTGAGPAGGGGAPGRPRAGAATDSPAAPPVAEDCADRVDNDADGAVDCADADCWGATCAETCWDAPHADEDLDGLANCEDPDCLSHSACRERCDEADGDEDGLVGCGDPDCAFALQCWEGLTVSGGPATVRRTRRVSLGGGRIERTARLTADSLRLEGRARDAARSSCWLGATGLIVSAKRVALVDDPAGSSTGSTRASVADLGAAAAPCPSLRMRDLRDGLPDPPPTVSSVWRMETGDLVPLFLLSPEETGAMSRFVLQVSAAGPSTWTADGGGVWVGTSAQSAQGTLWVVGP